MMVGIELVRDRATREPYRWEERMGIRVSQEARRRGAILRPLGQVVVLMPPLAMSHEDLARLLDVTYAAIRAVTTQSSDGTADTTAASG